MALASSILSYSQNSSRGPEGGRMYGAAHNL